jgi:hypothetical protein
MTQHIIPLPPDSPDAKSNKALVGSLSVALIFIACLAAYFVYRGNQFEEQATALNGQVASLTSQLEDAQKEIIALQPLAEKARTMPVVFRIDRHALNAGYNLYVINRARISLRFTYTVNGREVRGGRAASPVIDGGRFTIIPGLASGDVVKIASDGYDDKTVTIQ